MDTYNRTKAQTIKTIKENMNDYFNSYPHNFKDLKGTERYDKYDEKNKLAVWDINIINKFHKQLSKIEPNNKPVVIELINILAPIRCYLNSVFVEKITNGELKKVYGILLYYDSISKCLKTETHSVNKDKYGNYYDFTKELEQKDLTHKIFLELTLDNLNEDKIQYFIDSINQMVFYIPSKNYIPMIHNQGLGGYYQNYKQLIAMREHMKKVRVISYNSPTI